MSGRGAFGKSAPAEKKVDGIRAIAHDVQPVSGTGDFQRFPRQGHIARVVFHKQNFNSPAVMEFDIHCISLMGIHQGGSFNVYRVEAQVKLKGRT